MINQTEHSNTDTLHSATEEASANFLRVLTYHRVANPDPESPLSPQLISATVADFAKQMEFVSRNYRAVTMEAVLEAAVSGKPLPRRAVIITFDDGYYDLLNHALPVLTHFRIPATVFVPTSYPDHPDRAFWWDRLYGAVMFAPQEQLQDSPVGPLSLKDREARWMAVRRLQNHVKTLPHHEAMALVDTLYQTLEGDKTPRKTVMSWDELRYFHKSGITLAAHTQTHPLLDQIPLEEVRREVTGSQADLQREIGSVLPVFSYPNGNHNDAVVEVLREEGFVLGFTCLDGHSDLNTIDPLRLCRTDITRKTSLLLFRLRLLRLFTYIDKWRHR